MAEIASGLSTTEYAQWYFSLSSEEFNAMPFHHQCVLRMLALKNAIGYSRSTLIGALARVQP